MALQLMGTLPKFTSSNFMTSLFNRIKNKLRAERARHSESRKASETRSLQDEKKSRIKDYKIPQIGPGNIALPFNHVITIQNAHTLYDSFQAIGQECVLIDMSGGDLLESAKESGVYNPNNKYLLFDFTMSAEEADDMEALGSYAPTLPDITAFTEICRHFYSDIEPKLLQIHAFDQESFTQEAYESCEDFFEKQLMKLPKRLTETPEFMSTLTRHWLVNITARVEAGETDIKRIFNQSWSLVGKYVLEAKRHDRLVLKFENFLKEHKFSRAVHFCGPYTLPGTLMKLAFHNASIPCTLFHDAFMPPDQMKQINKTLPNFQVSKLDADILYENRSDQVAYEMMSKADDQVTLRYPVRTWASYDILGVPQEFLWASWLEYPAESVAVKNGAILQKFTGALGVDPRLKVVGNPLIEVSGETPAEINEEKPTVLVSVAPDIFSAVRFNSTLYLKSMEEYFAELKRIISLYVDDCNVVISLHPRLTPDNEFYELMSGLGEITNASTGQILPHVDYFITYVGSVMNFDADELDIPMLALSLYDEAKSYSQNAYSFKDMDIIENAGEMTLWLNSPRKVDFKTKTRMPSKGSTAQNIADFWAELSAPKS